MIVHFVGSTREIEEDFEWYKKVVEIIHAHGHVFVRDWMATLNTKVSDFLDASAQKIAGKCVPECRRAACLFVAYEGCAWGVGFEDDVRMSGLL